MNHKETVFFHYVHAKMLVTSEGAEYVDVNDERQTEIEETVERWNSPQGRCSM